MKKIIFICILFVTSVTFGADLYTTKFNPFTNKLDYVNLTVATATYAVTSGSGGGVSGSWWDLAVDGYLMMATSVITDPLWVLDADNYLMMKN